MMTTTWDRQYQTGCWDFLDQQLDEQFRHFVVAGCIRHLQTGEHILDLGSGSCQLLRVLDDADYGHYTAVDLSQTALDRAARKERVTKFQGSLEDFVAAQESGRYSTVLLSEVLYYLQDKDAVLRQIARILRDDGLFVVSMYQPEGPEDQSWAEQIQACETRAKQVLGEPLSVLSLREPTAAKHWRMLLFRKNLKAEPHS